MGMVPKRLSPGVQHAEEANLGAQMFWIGGYLAQRLRGRLEQDVVDHGLVLKGDDLDLLGHGEHDVEVGYVEQFRLTVLKPFGSCEALTFRAAVVATRVISETLMTAIAAPLDMTAESGGAATLDRDHGAPPAGGQRRAMMITERRPELAEHVRHFQPFPGHGPCLSDGHEVRHLRCHGMQRVQRTGGGANLAGGDS
jgi:hypothetical protein